MKLLKYLCIGISALSILSCSDWTSEEREVFENQEGMHRLIPLIEAQTEEDLTPTMREYFAQIREYRKTPHVKGFGWFGNWTGKGNSNSCNKKGHNRKSGVYGTLGTGRTDR